MRRAFRVVLAAALGGAAWLVAISPAPAGNGEFLTIIKEIGTNPPASATFVVHVSCTGTGPFTGQDVDADAPFDISGGTDTVSMPAPGYEGDCTITETTTAGATPTYACAEDQVGAATCGGGGASPATVAVNDPSTGSIATITVTNDFAAAEEPVVAAPVTAAPTTTG